MIMLPKSTLRFRFFARLERHAHAPARAATEAAAEHVQEDGEAHHAEEEEDAQCNAHEH